MGGGGQPGLSTVCIFCVAGQFLEVVDQERKHDRPWPEREIFGKVRFMGRESTARKFDARAYMDRVRRIQEAGETPAGR